MIIFLEGLPRSGKSHCAVKDYIVPSLQKGRKVFARINGLNHENIAIYSGVPLEDCRRLLVEITPEQVMTWWKHVENDAMVLLDEMQDYWPATVSIKPMDKESTEAITQHGHRGLDIVGMGQVLKDVHKTWRGRVDRKYVYIKKDVLGKEDEFQWSAYKQVSPDKFEQISKGDGKYDKGIFGCYASHKANVEVKGVLEDKNAVVWNNPLFKKWLPIYGVAFIAAIGVVVYQFKYGLGQQPDKPKQEVSNPRPIQQAQAAPVSVPVEPPPPASAPPPEPKGKSVNEVMPEPADMVESYSKSYRIRLAGFMQVGGESRGFIEWWGPDNSLIDRMSFRQISAFGWVVMLSQDGNLATLNKGSSRYAAMPWPLADLNGRMTQHRLDEIKPVQVQSDT